MCCEHSALISAIPPDAALVKTGMWVQIDSDTPHRPFDKLRVLTQVARFGIALIGLQSAIVSCSPSGRLFPISYNLRHTVFSALHMSGDKFTSRAYHNPMNCIFLVQV